VGHQACAGKNSCLKHQRVKENEPREGVIVKGQKKISELESFRRYRYPSQLAGSLAQ
jgi:hypothetical protein